MSDIIDDLFADTNVVSTHEVASALDLSEADARAWAEELDVAKIGNAFAWTPDDVDSLSDALEEEDDGDEAEEDEEDENDDEDDEDDAED